MRLEKAYYIATGKNNTDLAESIKKPWRRSYQPDVTDGEEGRVGGPGC